MKKFYVFILFHYNENIKSFSLHYGPVLLIYENQKLSKMFIHNFFGLSFRILIKYNT